MEHEAVIFEKLIWSWIKILSEVASHFPARLEKDSSLPKELLMNDYNQFIALAEHLEMRLSVCPHEPWGQFQWSLDFKIFLNQLLRRSYYCLSHLISLFDNQYIYNKTLPLHNFITLQHNPFAVKSYRNGLPTVFQKEFT